MLNLIETHTDKNLEQLSKIMEPMYDSEIEAECLLDEIDIILDKYPDGVFIPTDEGTWFYFSKEVTSLRTIVRMYTLEKKERPGYYFEQIAVDHIVVNFGSKGLLENIKDTDPSGMRRNGVSGYSEPYYWAIKVGNNQQFLGRLQLQERIKRYAYALIDYDNRNQLLIESRLKN